MTLNQTIATIIAAAEKMPLHEFMEFLWIANPKTYPNSFNIGGVVVSRDLIIDVFNDPEHWKCTLPSVPPSKCDTCGRNLGCVLKNMGEIDYQLPYNREFDFCEYFFNDELEY